MKAKLINEAISFERGKDPKSILGIGVTLEQEIEDFDFDEDSYEKLELSDLEDGVMENTLDIEKRVDHPMSGYQDSFEFCDYSIFLEKTGFDQYFVRVISKRGSGGIPKYLARQIENGDMEFPGVEDYDDFNPKMHPTQTYEQTFSSLEEALEYIDEELDFEG